MLIAHTSDMHIDQAPHSPTPGLRSRAWRGNIAVYRKMVEQVIERGADAFVHSGDAFAHGRPSPEAVMMLVDILKPLLTAGIPIVLIEGNHERLRHLSGQRTSTLVLAEALTAYGEVHVVAEGSELVRTKSGIQVACLPWLDTFTLLRDASKLDESESIQHEYIAAEAVNALARLAEQANNDGPLIASAHLTVSSAKRGSERDLTALFREPVVSASSLAALPFSYVALGHIHTPQELATGVWYSGSPQRFTFTDEKDIKGWNLVTITESGLMSVERIALPARAMLTIDLADENTEFEVPAKALVRVLLREGEREVPDAVIRAVEDARGRIVDTKRRRVKASDDSTTDDHMDETITPEDALRAWLAEFHPDADADEVVKMAAEVGL